MWYRRTVGWQTRQRRTRELALWMIGFYGTIFLLFVVVLCVAVSAPPPGVYVAGMSQ